MTGSLPTFVAVRLREHLDAIAKLGLEKGSEAFVAHECEHCDDLAAYLEALELACTIKDGALPPVVDCLATHVAAVARLGRMPHDAGDPALERKLEAFEAVFQGLFELETVPLEAPLSVSLNLPSPNPDGVTRLHPPPPMAMPTINRSSHLPMILAFAAAVLVGLAAWWWFVPGQESGRDPNVAVPPAGDQACDPKALQEAVSAFERRRTERPARLAEFPITEVRGALLAGCPSLPPALRWRLDNSISRPIEEGAAAYRVLRDSVCADPSVFSEIATMHAGERRPAVRKRCRLNEREFGGDTERVRGRISVYGFVLHQFLLDDGVDAELARAAVLMLATPLDAWSLASLPKSAHPRQWQDAVLVRLGGDFVEFPGRPKVAMDDGQLPELPGARAWLASEVEDGFASEVEDGFPNEEASVAFQASPSTPAPALVGLMKLLGPVWPAQILVTDAYGLLAAEQISLAPDDHDATHRVSIEGGRFSISATDTNARPVAGGPIADGFLEVEQWAGSLTNPADVRLTIDPRGLTVQNLVDLYVALRGRDCDLLLAMQSEDLPAGCHMLDVRLDRGEE